MKTSWILFASLILSSSLIAGCAAEAPAPEAMAMLEQALQDESFQATVRLLESRGVAVDLDAPVLEAGDDGSERLVFHLDSETQEALIFEASAGGEPRVLLREAREPSPEPAAACGTTLYSNSCEYGPWLSGQGCSSSPLYKYDNYTRTYTTTGRKLTYTYSRFSCTWESKPVDCTPSCG